MPLVTLEDVTIRFRGPALLEDVSCIIEPRQRIGLLGRNGAGKSTLLKMLSGDLEPDHGRIVLGADVRVSWLPQAVPTDMKGDVFSLVKQGIASDSGFDKWEVEHRTAQILSRMDLEPQQPVESMSAGMKRRVLLAQALVQSPELLLLDEPTNHLDIDSIRWLEDFLSRYDRAFMFITHDRQFLRRLADRILEIEGGQLFDWSCDYDTFLKRKEAALAAQEKQEKLFDKKLAEEEAWIRQGIKARRTRNEGRVRALKELRRVRSERRDKVGTSNLQIQEGIRSGNLVAKAEDLYFRYSSAEESEASREILAGFSCTIMRGDKIGIVGPNGVGKTTLLKILLGKLAPSEGSVKLGSNLQIAYFDQLRQSLDAKKTIEEEVADGYQTVNIAGQSKHVLGYLQDFLFSPERARTKIQYLSGGEINRILLAKLFAKPANLIVLDEPTNDLDAETMELLEERLLEYSGTVLVVSHDREFLNNVATSCYAFEPKGEGQFQLREYIGGYDDWQRQAASHASQSLGKASNTGNEKSQVQSQPKTVHQESKQSSSTTKRRLSFKENKELESLPGEIEILEQSIQEIHSAMADPDFYKQDGSDISAKQDELAKLESQLAAAYHRWEELEGNA